MPRAGRRAIDPQAQPAPDYAFDQRIAWSCRRNPRRCWSGTVRTCGHRCGEQPPVCILNSVVREWVVTPSPSEVHHDRLDRDRLALGAGAWIRFRMTVFQAQAWAQASVFIYPKPKPTAPKADIGWREKLAIVE